MDTLIQAENLTRQFGGYCAVDNISFTLQRGEILGFLGRNGAGKSTTMRMICGALAPTGGSIHINGVNLLKNPGSAKMQLGYLPDTPPLYKNATVNEYLFFCARLHRIPRTRIRRSVELARERCDLEGAGNRLIKNLSRGYQQRIGIAQAIIHTPPVVILDEPTVGLDPVQVGQMRALIHSLADDHGIILSTHILPEAQTVCSRVQIMDRGRIVMKSGINDLESQLQLSSLLITTRKSLPSDRIFAIPGVNQVENVDNNRLRVIFQRAMNPAAELAEYAVNSNCGLLELTPEATNMERIFLDLTRPASGSESTNA